MANPNPHTRQRDTHAYPSVKAYLATFAALLVLLVVAVWVAELELGRWNFPVALGIATSKALLILLIFMHVRYSPRLIGLIAMAGVYWLSLLVGGALADYFTRGSPPLWR